MQGYRLVFAFVSIGLLVTIFIKTSSNHFAQKNPSSLRESYFRSVLSESPKGRGKAPILEVAGNPSTWHKAPSVPQQPIVQTSTHPVLERFVVYNEFGQVYPEESQFEAQTQTQTQTQTPAQPETQTPAQTPTPTQSSSSPQEQQEAPLQVAHSPVPSPLYQPIERVVVPDNFTYSWRDMLAIRLQPLHPLPGQGDIELVVVDYMKGRGAVIVVPCTSVIGLGRFSSGIIRRLPNIMTFLNRVYNRPQLANVQRHMFALSFGDQGICDEPCVPAASVAASSARAHVTKKMHLIPDAHFIMQDGYPGQRRDMAFWNSQPENAWERKAPKVFWRGSSTGEPAPLQGQDYYANQRCLAAVLSVSDKYSLILNARISSFVQGDHVTEQEFRSKGLLGSSVGSSGWIKYKYILDIDGNTNSWDGLFWKLLSNSVVFKVRSREEPRYVSWYYDRLVAWKHYVPIAPDFSDLEEKFNWALENDAEARKIADQATALAQSITLDTETDYVANVLAKSAAHFDATGIDEAFGPRGFRQASSCSNTGPISLCGGDMDFREDARCTATADA